MLGFGLSRDIIINKLDNGESLSWEDLLQVFRCNDKPIAKAVYYLLMKLKGESRDLFVDLINKDFKIWPHYKLDTEAINLNYFDKWKFVCVNRETKNFVPEESKKNEALNDLKNSLFEDMLAK